MVVNNPQSVDRSYKFMYKLLELKFHRYFYREGNNIEFIETEIPDTGQRKDIAVKVDGKTIQITEFMAKALNDDKLHDIFDYHDSSRTDPSYDDFNVKTGVISIANPNHGKNKVEIDENITFHVTPIFTKRNDGWKVLSSLVYKTVIQEELSDKEAIDLLILPDMNIKLPIKALMCLIILLIGKANIQDKDFKKKIVLCEINVLSRFFKDEELSEMIEMLQTQTTNPEVARIIEKYGQGFDVIYFDGKADGYVEGEAKGYENGKADGYENGKADGYENSKADIARKLLANGVDEEIISKCTEISIDELKKLKRKL